MPRNPSDYEFKWDDANVTYESMADGSQLRVQAPKLMKGADFTLTWKYANRRVIRFISQLCNQAYPLPGTAHKITVDGIQPPMQVYAWFDTPNAKMSQEIYSPKIGEGGTLHDFQVKCRTDGPGFRSLNPVPGASTTSSSQVAGWFGGVVGNAYDCLPAWNGVQWIQHLSASTTSVNISNLGTQEWWPAVRFSGPFASMTATQQYADVDGTGQGVQFKWAGNPILLGQQVLFDLQRLRCWTIISGTQTEVYTFSVSTASDGNPFPFWPGMSPGANGWSLTVASQSASTMVDFSNLGTETFRYWG